MDRKTNQIQTSDLNPTMVASTTFDSILRQIFTSNLNFQVQISPFSANISLKKSPIKDKFGSPLLPRPETLPSSVPQPASNADLVAMAAKNMILENDLEAVRKDHARVTKDCETAHERIKWLNAQLTVKHENIEEVTKKNDPVNALNKEISYLIKVNEEFTATNKNLKEEIKYLEETIKKGSNISDNLHKELNKTKVKHEKEKKVILKEHKAEIKSWRIDLGEVNKKKIKLGEKLDKAEKLIVRESSSVLPVPLEESSSPLQADESSSSKTESFQSDSAVPEETLCSICAVRIDDYVPEYFLGERYNPACEKCKANDSFSNSDEKFYSLDSDPTCISLNFIPPSMVSHWLPVHYKSFKNPSSINSMVTHCAKLPKPGDCFISVEEALEMMREIFEKMSNKG